MWPRSRRTASTSSQCVITGPPYAIRSPDAARGGSASSPRRGQAVRSGGHGIARERIPQSAHGLVGGITPFDSHPGLGVDEQAAHLGQKLRRARRRAIERLDPLQSLEHSPRFLHATG